MELSRPQEANAAKTIFEEHGIDDSAKKLASKLAVLNMKMKRKNNLVNPDLTILEVCQKIGRNYCSGYILEVHKYITYIANGPEKNYSLDGQE